MENRQSEACKLTYSVSTPSRCLERGGASKAGPGGPTRVRACSGGGWARRCGRIRVRHWGDQISQARQGRPFCFAESAGKAAAPVTPGDSAKGTGRAGGAVQPLCDSTPPPHPPPGGSSVVLTRLFNAHRGREVLLSASPPRGGLRLGRLTGLFGRVEVIERGPFHAGLQMCPFQCSRLYHHGNLRATTGSQAGAIFILGPLTPGGRTAGKVPKPPWGVRG